MPHQIVQVYLAQIYSKMRFYIVYNEGTKRPGMPWIMKKMPILWIVMRFVFLFNLIFFGINANIFWRFLKKSALARTDSLIFKGLTSRGSQREIICDFLNGKWNIKMILFKPATARKAPLTGSTFQQLLTSLRLQRSPECNATCFTKTELAVLKIKKNISLMKSDWHWQENRFTPYFLSHWLPVLKEACHW